MTDRLLQAGIRTSGVGVTLVNGIALVNNLQVGNSIAQADAIFSTAGTTKTGNSDLVDGQILGVNSETLSSIGAEGVVFVDLDLHIIALTQAGVFAVGAGVNLDVVALMVVTLSRWLMVLVTDALSRLP